MIAVAVIEVCVRLIRIFTSSFKSSFLISSGLSIRQGLPDESWAMLIDRHTDKNERGLLVFPGRAL